MTFRIFLKTSDLPNTTFQGYRFFDLRDLYVVLFDDRQSLFSPSNKGQFFYR